MEPRSPLGGVAGMLRAHLLRRPRAGCSAEPPTLQKSVRVRRTVLMIVGGITLSGTSSVDAQTIHGRVVDAVRNEPIRGVIITAMDSGGSTLARSATTETGMFSLQIGASRPLRLLVQQPGYMTHTRSIASSGGGAVDLGDIPLQPSALRLDSISARAEARNPVLARTGYYDRRQSGVGFFLERDAIAQKKARTATDILRAVPNVTILRRGGGTDILIRATVTFRGRTQCTPPIYLNGILIAFGQSPDRFDLETLRADDIEAVEIYSGPASIPARFGGAHSACGVIAFWTR